jgi:hypothetical protein
MAATAKTIINNVAVECGLAAVNDPYGSGDQNFILLKTLLDTASQELLRMRDWSQFTREATVAGTGTDVAFSVPADFIRYIVSTGWNRTQLQPFSPPLNAQEWQQLKAEQAVSIPYTYWRFTGGRIEFLTAPALADDIRYEYLSSYWAATADGVGYGSKTTCSASTDYCLLDEPAITRFLKVKFLTAKGLEVGPAAIEFQMAYRQAAGGEPARVLSLPGGMGYDPVIIGPANVPETGYGT